MNITSDWSEVKNILAIRLDNLGDVLICQPALRALKDGLPNARLTLLASPNGAQAAPLIPSVDEVIARSVVWQDAQGKMPLDVLRELRLAEELRERAFDLAIIFTSFAQSPYPPAYVCYLAGVPRRIGQSKEFGGSLLTTWVKASSDAMHQIDRNLRLIEAMGLPIEQREIRLTIPPAARDSVAAKLADKGIAPEQGFIVMNTTTSCSARTYPWPRFAQLARILTQSWPVVLTGQTRDATVLDQIGQAAGSERLVSLGGQTSVTELVALIDQCSLLVTNLTSTMHIASAVGTPTIVLFAGTELESQWQPRGCPSLLLRRETDCSPCYLFDCPTGQQCLDITPEEVADACARLLRERRPERGRP